MISGRIISDSDLCFLRDSDARDVITLAKKITDELSAAGNPHLNVNALIDLVSAWRGGYIWEEIERLDLLLRLANQMRRLDNRRGHD